MQHICTNTKITNVSKTLVGYVLANFTAVTAKFKNASKLSDNFLACVKFVNIHRDKFNLTRLMYIRRLKENC